MKKLLLLLLAFAAVNYSQAQITFTNNDIPSPPATQVSAVDTLPTGIVPGPKGVNQTWNFANIVQRITETTTHKTAAQAGYGSTYPTATNAVTTDNAKYAFFSNSSTKYTALGLAGDLLNTGTPLSVTFSPTFDAYKFPTNYGGNFGGNYGFTKTVSGASINQPSVYQVRATYTATYTDSIDAWGACTTPLGVYSTLRQRHKEYTHTVVDYQVSQFVPVWTTLSDTYDTTLVYNWLAKETKGPVVSLTVNKQGAVSRATYSLTPPAPIANFTFVVNGGGVAQFTNTSTNSPASYSWTFGDAGTSIATNPSHTYATSNTYNVCLTATNTTGSDTKCQNVPVTINTAAPFHAAIAGTVEPCSNQSTGLTYSDSSRAGNSYTWNITGGTITSGSGTNAVTVNWNGVGTHNIQLIECNGGSTFCDTVSVSVTINPPLASGFSESICAGQSYMFNGQARTASGTYYDTLTASTGCDSIITLTLNVNPLPLPVVNLWGADTLSTDPTYVSYQWYDANGIINGATLDTFLVTRNGDYRVFVTDQNGCSDTSASKFVLIEGINNLTTLEGVNISPNPSNGKFVLSILGISKSISIDVVNTAGQTFYTEQLKDQSSLKKELNFSTLAKGVYLLKVSTENGVAVKRVVVQ